jgi:hypothetical protein
MQGRSTTLAESRGNAPGVGAQLTPAQEDPDAQIRGNPPFREEV